MYHTKAKQLLLFEIRQLRNLKHEIGDITNLVPDLHTGVVFKNIVLLDDSLLLQQVTRHKTIPSRSMIVKQH